MNKVIKNFPSQIYSKFPLRYCTLNFEAFRSPLTVRCIFNFNFNRLNHFKLKSSQIIKFLPSCRMSKFYESSNVQ